MKPKKMIIFIFIFVIIFGGCSNNANQQDTNETIAAKSQQEQTISPNLYDDGNYIELNYRDATFGDIGMDKPVVFRGKISQTINDSEFVMQTKYKCYIPGTFSCEQGDYEEQGVLLLFPIRPKILENDIVSVFGRYNGSTKRETILTSEERTIPQFTVDYYRIGRSPLYDAKSGQYVDGDFINIDTGRVDKYGLKIYKNVFKTNEEIKQLKAQQEQEQAKVQAQYEQEQAEAAAKAEQEQAEAAAKAEKEQAEADAIANAEAKKINSAARLIGVSPDNIITKQNSKGITIYCTSDESICKTEKEVAAHSN